MGFEKNNLLHFLWKKCTSAPGVIVLGIIFSGLLVYVYVEILKKPENKHIIEGKYRHTKTGLENSDDFENPDVKTEITIKDNDLTEALMRLSQGHQHTVLVSVINRGYLNLTYNWLCNTRKWDIHRQVLFIVFDKQTKASLKMDWPEVTSIFFDGMDETSGFSFGTAGYARIVLNRVGIMTKILQHDVTFFLFETDSVWFRNPMPFLDLVSKGYDVAVTAMTPLYYGTEGYCICFLYIHPTRTMTKFWNRMLYKMTIEQERIKSLGSNSSVDKYPAFSMQKTFSDLLNKKYAGVHKLVLPRDLFPDGYHYMKDSNKTKTKNDTLVYILHNNYIVGTDKKIQRAKDAGHWFLKDDLTCAM